MFTGAMGALMLCIAAPSFAAPTPPPPPPGGQAQAQGPHMRGPGGRFHDFRGARGFQRANPEERAKRRAEMFARMDANRDGRVTEPEFHAFHEARKRERQHRMFQRFSGGQDSVTLDQLNARALTRERQMQERFQNRRGAGGARGPFDGRDFDRPAPPAPPPPPAR
jgi:hypothetical protein